ncbi:MAG: prolipoprotein diacylglyceryl transferase [Coriobacteriia bacterium]|nr:prolipoprotein diacylglyceryl transferase [Coriobacteriia bacterium]MCL2606102.1 prolipoprotein diacylglyceryl transferase [Coriobacteriia bacterium]
MAELLQNIQAMDPVAFSVGSLAIRWYGLSYVLGFLAASGLAYYFAKRWKTEFSFDDLITVLLGVSLGLIIGARIGFCLLYNPAYYLANPVQMIAFWQGGIAGMSFHGGLIGGVIGGAISARIIKMPLLSLGDLVIIGAPIGLGLGRMANYINGELWGRVSEVPWAVVFEGAGPLARHPSQVYEALLQGLLIFAVLLYMALCAAKKEEPPVQGSLLGTFLVLYGAVRIFAEFFREPDAHIGFLAGNWLTMGMLLSMPMLILGAFLLWRAYGKQVFAIEKRTNK